MPRDTTLIFTIKNMNFQGKLFREGMLPVYKSQLNPVWRRIKQPIISLETTEAGLEVTFQHTFENFSDTIYFAFTFPWSYSDNLDFLDYLSLQAEKRAATLYFHRETLAFSRENRKIELLTLSSPKNMSDSTEKTLANLFPSEKSRAKRFEGKRYVLITARVHPGEVPGSLILNGLLKFLCISDEKSAKEVLDHYVFLIIPLLNPDGVYRGQYRTDPQGLNLNRFYANPNHIEHPSVYAVKELANYLAVSKRLFMYLDLHAHASKKGCFMFANAADFAKQTEICAFPRLLAMNCGLFDYSACDFSQRNMFSKEKGDEFSKEGCSRVAIFKSTGLLYSYTLECNYNMPTIATGFRGTFEEEKQGKGQTRDFFAKTAEFDLENGELLDFLLGNRGNSQGNALETAPQGFTIEDFEEIGRKIAISLLDFSAETTSKSLRILKAEVAVNLLKKPPFRFEPHLRKILKGLATVDCKKALKELIFLLENGEKKEKIARNGEISRKNEEFPEKKPKRASSTLKTQLKM